MVCKTCGKPVETGEKMCRNCGTLTEFGLESQMVGLKKPQQTNDFQQNAARFGEVTVRERKASVFASIDPKIAGIILLISMLVIFFGTFFYYESKNITVEMKGYDITLPASMREVKDRSFEVMDSISCDSYANNRMEFTCIRYDAETIIPDLSLNPSNDDIEGLDAYYTAKSELEMLDLNFPEMLDGIFSEKLKNYERKKLQGRVLEFTYSDKAMVDNFVAVHIEVKDHTVYQFSLLCSNDQKSKLEKKFKDIFKSIEMH